MTIKLKYLLFFEVILLIFRLNCHAQIMTNNSGLIHLSAGSIVAVSGSLSNLSGSQFENSGTLIVIGDITNDAGFQSPGIIELSGNWINNSNFSALGGDVLLEGSNQNIGGTNLTTFNNLVLNGTGIKSLLHDINISGILTLNDRELNVGNYRLLVENTSTVAINRTTGFISNNINGRLVLRTSSVSGYLFPMGSSSGISRYRPIEITPDQTNLNKYSVGFINNDANNEGYNRNQTDTGICGLNDLYYHHISIDSGSTSADISIYYDQTNDGNWNTSANWKTTPSILWKLADSTSVIPGTPFNKIQINNWSFSGTSAFILGNQSVALTLGSDLTGCTGDTFTLGPQTTYPAYLWSTGANTQFINVTLPGTYFLTVTSNGCSAVDTVIVSVTSLPVANAGQDVTICNGSSTQLNASGGSSYLWLNSSYLSDTVISNPLATPPVTTTYIVEVSNGSCNAYDSVVVTVIPNPTADAGSDEIMCNGSSVQLNAGGGTSYNWLTTYNLSNPAINNPVASPLITTSYIVEVANGICLDYDTVVVTVLPSPSADAGPDVTICNGSTTQLNAGGGTSYNWLTTYNLSNPAINNPVASPDVTTSYIVEVSDGTCIDYDTVNVIVLSNPVADAGPDITICNGYTTQLNAGGGTSYNWLTTYNLSNPAINNPIASPVITTPYIVEVANGICLDYDTVVVTVLPSPSADAGSDIIICNGSSAQLNAEGGTSYNWLTTYNLSNAAINNPIASPLITTPYIVEVSNGTCLDYDTVVVIVLPSPSANAGSDVTICNGSTTQLNAGGGTSYNWLTTNNLSNTSINNPIASPVITTPYIVEVSNGTCLDYDTVVVTVLPSPVVNAGSNNTVNSGTPFFLSAFAPTAVTVNWSPATGLSNPAILNPVATLYETTTYLFTVYDINGCLATDTLIIYVTQNPELVIYNTFTPNLDGTNDTWTVENIGQYPDNHLWIYNRNGHLVYEKTGYNNEWDGRYYGSDLPAATYYFILKIEGFDTFEGDITIIR